MIFESKLQELKSNYIVLDVISLDAMTEDFEVSRSWLVQNCKSLHKSVFEQNERIVFTMTSDLYDKKSLGVRLRTLQKVINQIDISNFFIVVLTTNPEILEEATEMQALSTDPVPVSCVYVSGSWTSLAIDSKKLTHENYQYGSPAPVGIGLHELSNREKFLLTESRVFCMYPWMHLHAWPTGESWPCCEANMEAGCVGNTHTDSLRTIWNSQPMKQLRLDMLAEKENKQCTRCYEKEKSGFFSGRKSANKHHGHHIGKIEKTQKDGFLDDFQMTYWDIRFSNLCNLKCRSCGHIFSSQWYQDQVKLAGPEWAKTNKVLNFAGRHETDMWEQLIPHLDYVEQIYFAGGEPLMMAEHYNILDELERRERFDVRLIYNTNFTHVKLKDRSVFDYWKRFQSVAVGASLDAMGPRAEYIRKGTDWAIVEHNRQQMLQICPDVDFYISPTLSILNAWHLPDFHRDWVAKGYIRPQDLNVNILQGPDFYRIDIAPIKFKQRLRVKYLEHLEWLRPLDQLQRATVGFESAIKFMMDTDNSQRLDKFWSKTAELDQIRQEKILQILPELEALR